MDQVIDEPDECVLSTDQLTLMRLWLLQAKYFPPLIFSYACFLPFISLSLSPSSLPSVSPPHSKMEKSCYNSCGRFLAMYTAEWRNIYTMGYGDDSAQFVSLRQGMTFPFPLPPHGQIKRNKLVHVLVHIHTPTRIYINTLFASIVVVSEGRSVPASQRQRACCWGDCLAEV